MFEVHSKLSRNMPRYKIRTLYNLSHRIIFCNLEYVTHTLIFLILAHKKWFLANVFSH